FHTFNSLYNQNKQIIFTSDIPPKELNGIEQRLISRFEQGLLADIAPPEYETRIAIIKRKAELYGMNLPDSIVDFLADKLKTNIRQLEGAITKINALTL
ncbi:DnaA/Hda family protein, partial [[Eubacterium] siraeum]|nr:DnaA/Hda family protein [[Eubacterium] siraeum]